MLFPKSYLGFYINDRSSSSIRNSRPRMSLKLDQGSRPPFLPLNEGETWHGYLTPFRLSSTMKHPIHIVRFDAVVVDCCSSEQFATRANDRARCWKSLPGVFGDAS